MNNRLCIFLLVLGMMLAYCLGLYTGEIMGKDEANQFVTKLRQ